MNYREEVLKNCPGFETDLMAKKISLAGLGLVGEAAEVLEVFGDEDAYFGAGCPPEIGCKIVKELGDVYWYAEYLCAALRVMKEQCMNAAADHHAEANAIASIELMLRTGQIADIIKKVLHHEVPIGNRHNEIVILLGRVYVALFRIERLIGVTEEEVKTANVAKLRARHPNGWSPESQQAKADELVGK